MTGIFQISKENLSTTHPGVEKDNILNVYLTDSIILQYMDRGSQNLLTLLQIITTDLFQNYRSITINNNIHFKIVIEY